MTTVLSRFIFLLFAVDDVVLMVCFKPGLTSSRRLALG